MTHGKEGDGQAGAKEDDEVEGQLVPESEKKRFKQVYLCLIEGHEY